MPNCNPHVINPLVRLGFGWRSYEQEHIVYLKMDMRFVFFTFMMTWAWNQVQRSA